MSVPNYSAPKEWLPTEESSDFYLEVHKNHELKSQLELKATPEKSHFVLGRIEELVDLLVPHPSVSRQHCIIQFNAIDKSWMIYDLNSTHGTKVNNKKISAKEFIRLREGSQIQLAESQSQFVLMSHLNDDDQQEESLGEMNGEELEEFLKKEKQTQKEKAEKTKETESTFEFKEKRPKEISKRKLKKMFEQEAMEDEEEFDFTKKSKQPKNEIKKPEQKYLTKPQVEQRIKDLEKELKEILQELDQLKKPKEQNSEEVDDLDAFMQTIHDDVNQQKEAELNKKIISLEENLKEQQRILKHFD